MTSFDNKYPGGYLLLAIFISLLDPSSAIADSLHHGSSHGASSFDYPLLILLSEYILLRLYYLHYARHHGLSDIAKRQFFNHRLVLIEGEQEVSLGWKGQVYSVGVLARLELVGIQEQAQVSNKGHWVYNFQKVQVHV